ncbi:hypothetical protein [Myxococcus sp. AS-1-15]|uniref:hypothetical protein n=1 Tax=Myxococcus sp. AS-1-15 TaxID=2874600 RepID=UPI001CC1A168|nr:hypothetical protein [Myxococcus sp. AS-1-15]MBZ4395840.1 hypothetical protein [Myxococcus sp. AS-1-15]
METAIVVPMRVFRVLGIIQLETLAGRTLEVSEYSYSGGITAGWSASVPSLGLVRMSGESPFQLVDSGVGGDPWKKRAVPAPAARK